MLKVSVIVPVYNVERYLARCIDSVINQTYKNIELILVDDGSTDNSGMICDDYEKRDNRIVVIHKANGGVSSARNAALNIISGDYIMFLDSDDALDTNAIEVCMICTEKAKWDIVLFGFHMYTEKDEGVVFQNNVSYKEEQFGKKNQIVSRFSECYRKGYFNFITDKLFRSSLINDHSIRFDSNFDIGGEDGLFMLELVSYLSNMKVTAEVFYQYYRRSNESVTQLFRPRKFDRYYERVVKIYDFMVAEHCIDTEYIIELYGTYFLWAYESTFHSSCKLNIFERFCYVIKVFKKKDFIPNQRSVNNTVLNDLGVFPNHSKSSLIALKLFYRRHFLLLSIWNILIYLKSR